MDRDFDESLFQFGRTQVTKEGSTVSFSVSGDDQEEVIRIYGDLVETIQKGEN